MNRRSSRSTAVLSFVVALCALLSVPALTSANLVTDLVKQAGDGGAGNAPAPGSPTESQDPTPQAGVPPTYTPPMHGDNPHGQGTVGTVDLAPGDDLPMSGDPNGGDPMAGGEDVVIGRSRGEQNCTDPNDSSTCTYHGSNTALALFGNEVIGNETNEGDLPTGGPLDPLQQTVLDAICLGSTGQICVTVLAMNSSTDETGSQNSFQAADVHLGDPTPGGMQRMDASVASSEGNISDDGTCQTADGSANAGTVSAGGGALTADALSSSSSSTACNDGSPDQNTQSGNVVNPQGNAVPFPPGCEGVGGEGVPNTNADQLAPLLSAVCNAESSTALGSTGSGVGDPYGVREALTVFVIDAVPLLKLTSAASESHAQAPPCPAGTVAGPNGCQPDSCDTNPELCPEPSCETDPSLCPPTECDPAVEDCEPSEPKSKKDGPAASQAGPGKGELAFTGANVLLIAMMGIGLLGGGLALKAGMHARRSNGA